MTTVVRSEIAHAWDLVKAQDVRLVVPSIPKPPLLHMKHPMKDKLLAIQKYLNALQYNYTGTVYFDINKKRSFKSIVGTAKEMVREALPIQCLEAVFLAAYLTAPLTQIDRFPVSFKSTGLHGNTEHRHIVLAIRIVQNQTVLWGALGLSRSNKLMYKSATFSHLSELLCEFRQGFHAVNHRLDKIYIGYPFSHDIHSSERVKWRMLNMPVNDCNWAQVARQTDMFAHEAADLASYYRSHGTVPEYFAAKYTLHDPE